jgi:predicted DNA-binding protein
MPEQTQISIRLPSELVQELESLAHQEERSVTAEIRRLIKLHLSTNGVATV